MNFKEISLEDIDIEDNTYRVRFRDPDRCLIESIDRVGLINPPWVKYHADREIYQVVTGFRRIQALRELGRKTVTVRVVEADDPDESGLMEGAILENLTCGPFDPVEISRSIGMLHGTGVEDDEIVDRYLPLLGLKKEKTALESYRSLADLPADITEAVSSGDLKVDSVDRVMRRFEKEEGDEILRLIRDLRLGVNRQRELITLLDEISGRDEVGVTDILEGDEIRSILRTGKPNIPQMVRALFLHLRRIRSPRTMELADRVKKKVSELGLDPAVALEFSPYLEERLARVSFGFRSREEYLKILENLTNLGEGEEVEGLLDDLFGKDEPGEG